jgi:GTP-binding protein
LKIDARFVRSAAGAADLPQDGLAEIAMVGRSNVGKSSLINALVRSKLARTSGAPGKTRLANIYRVARGGGPFYLVDLPGFGFARGRESAKEFEALTAAYFDRAAGPETRSALLLVDSRHPGLANDIEAWGWLRGIAAAQRLAAAKVVATKVDKLARGERIRAMRELESVLEHSVLPVSAVTGEGLDELWILIDRLAANSRNREQTATPRATGPTEAQKRPPAPSRAGGPRKPPKK